MGDADASIGVFDSGLGGLSVLVALRAALPRERFVYFADSAHAPYGERDEAYVVTRSLEIAEELLERQGCKALVVACNTATAVAVAALRARWPRLPIVGVEPALKPAAAHTRTLRVGVMATRGTLGSAKFKALLHGLGQEAHFVLQACDGLAEAIEHGDDAQVRLLCQRYLAAMGRFGHAAGQIDVLVLGCTHYPLVADVLVPLLPDDIELIHTGPAVARQCQRVLRDARLLREERDAAGEVRWMSSGDVGALRQAALRLIGIGD